MKDRFRQMRKVLEMTQEELEDVLEIRSSGNKRTSAVPKWEGGKVKPSAEVLEKLSQKLKVNINWLLTGEGEMFLPDAPEKEASSVQERPLEESLPPHKYRDFYLRKSHFTELIEKVEKSAEDVKDDLREGLADISRKLDALAQFPGEAAKDINVTYIEDYIRSRLARQRNHYVKRQMTELNYPIGAGGVYIDEYSNESDWIGGTVTESVPDSAEYVTMVQGDSMEPTVQDGASIYWKKALLEEIRNGDLVVHFNAEVMEFKLRRIHYLKQGDKRIAVLAADNPKVLDTTIVDENIHIYGVVVYGKNRRG